MRVSRNATKSVPVCVCPRARVGSCMARHCFTVKSTTIHSAPSGHTARTWSFSDAPCGSTMFFVVSLLMFALRRLAPLAGTLHAA